MTIEEFDNAKFGACDIISYNGDNHRIVGVNFGQRKLAIRLNPLVGGGSKLIWLRHDHVEIIKQTQCG